MASPLTDTIYRDDVDGRVWRVVPDSFSSDKCWCYFCDNLKKCDVWYPANAESPKRDVCRSCFKEHLKVAE